MNKESNKGWNSFRYALIGWQTFWKCELNARIHVAIAIFVSITGIIFRISTTEWILQILCIALVIGSEMINTAIELMVDKWSPQFDDTAAKVKDIAAGAVMLSSLTAAITGCIIYLPKAYEVTIQLIVST